MNNLLTRSAANPTAFPYDLIIRASPRWEVWKEERKVQLYRLEQAFVFNDPKWGAIEIPKGFMTDFASVPTMTKFIVDNDSPDVLFGSLPHDYLYKHKGVLPDGRKLTRREADEVLREAMRATGAPEWMIFRVFWSVRVGGSGTFNEP